MPNLHQSVRNSESSSIEEAKQNNTKKKSIFNFSIPLILSKTEINRGQKIAKNAKFVKKIAENTQISSKYCEKHEDFIKSCEKHGMFVKEYRKKPKCCKSKITNFVKRE